MLYCTANVSRTVHLLDTVSKVDTVYVYLAVAQSCIALHCAHSVQSVASRPVLLLSQRVVGGGGGGMAVLW